MNTLDKVIVVMAVVIVLPILVVIWLELDQCESETGRACAVRAVPVEFDQ